MTEDLGEKGSGGEVLRGVSLRFGGGEFDTSNTPRVAREFLGLAGGKLPDCALERTEGKKEEGEEKYLREREKGNGRGDKRG